MSPTVEPILEIRDLKKHYPITRGLLRKQVGVVRAVDGVFLSVPAGRTVGLVGESGCGKTTTGHCVMGGTPATSGEIIFHHPELGPMDLAKADARQMAQARRAMQMRLAQDDARTTHVAHLLHALSYRGVLARGFALVRDADGHPLHHAHAIAGGSRIRIEFADGTIWNPATIAALLDTGSELNDNIRGDRWDTLSEGAGSDIAVQIVVLLKSAGVDLAICFAANDALFEIRERG